MNQQRQKVLVLASDPVTHRTVATIMKDRWLVLPTTDLRIAMEVLQRAKDIDAILVDHPGKGFKAIELLGRVREVSPSTARIVLTEFADLSGIIQGLHVGAIQAIVQKPIQMEELTASIMVAARGNLMEEPGDRPCSGAV